MAGGIVAGGVIEYDSPGPRGSMEYATVHGAGHGVPQHRPQAALAMLPHARGQRLGRLLIASAVAHSARSHTRTRAAPAPLLC